MTSAEADEEVAAEGPGVIDATPFSGTKNCQQVLVDDDGTARNISGQSSLLFYPRRCHCDTSSRID